MQPHSFKPGDRVRYDTYGTRADWRGKLGTVRNITSDHVHVQWDCGAEGYVSRMKYLLPVSEVDAALAVLKKHGEVTFKPYFQPVAVKLNGDYTAFVQKGYVEVGCQTFSFQVIRDLAAAVDAVRKDYGLAA